MLMLMLTLTLPSVVFYLQYSVLHTCSASTNMTISTSTIYRTATRCGMRSLDSSSRSRSSSRQGRHGDTIIIQYCVCVGDDVVQKQNSVSRMNQSRMMSEFCVVAEKKGTMEYVKYVCVCLPVRHFRKHHKTIKWRQLERQALFMFGRRP